MKRNTRLLLSLITIVIGWLLGGFGFTTKLGHPISTISFFLGIILIIIGIIYFILTAKE
jgi:predicted RND superfamily exporter protein